MAQTTTIDDVIIIGAGVSGLAAANFLQKYTENVKIKMLEAKGRCGGRVLGKKLSTANGTESFDLGGQWFASTQKNVVRLLEEHGLETYKQYTDGKTMNILDKGKKFYTNDLLDVTLDALPHIYDLVRGFKKFDDLAQMISIEDPMSHPSAREWDSMTMETAKNWLFFTQACRKLLDLSVLSVFGLHPRQVSFLYVLMYFKCGGGCASMLDDTFEGNAQEYKVKSEEGICRIGTLDGQTFASKYVILTIPPHLRSKIEFSPPLPCYHSKFIEHQHPGHLIKFVATYERRFWVDHGLSGLTFHWPFYEMETPHPVHITFDATTTLGSPAILGFIEGSFGDRTAAELEEGILRSLVLFFGPDAETPMDLVVQNWEKEPYNGGCPVDFSAPGAISLYGDVWLRKPFYNVHFAGTESATIWRGLIDGAIQSGQRAAIEILQKMDPDYHHSVLKYKDVFLPGTEHAYKLPYYVLNGLILCAGVLVMGCVAWSVHSRVITFNGINERLIKMF
ncbi:probable flavin-containing monoamine oxidase A isoform X2 [Hydractinia symbiolongicarpus]|uniref:probable flavin-containing monoamine oxidase A isoform X2 n=1 Tax=Hydractinia symbiolongicarpus TaxID=13093 RepID=UPI00254F6A66|nr:probable flavin-containing monoamine oxidase A isoform X2 [Hydractinia symbiolongicarpus]